METSMCHFPQAAVLRQQPNGMSISALCKWCQWWATSMAMAKTTLSAFTKVAEISMPAWWMEMCMWRYRLAADLESAPNGTSSFVRVEKSLAWAMSMATARMTLSVLCVVDRTAGLE